MMRIFRLTVFASFLFLLSSSALAQTAITYQGRLMQNGVPAAGVFDISFRLYDAASGGTQVGSEVIVTGVSVPSGGIFTVELDFGAVPFTSGQAGWVEISVKPNGSPDPFTLLSPRQALTRTPYSIASMSADSADTAATATNASQLGGVPAADYVVTSDTRLSDARDPLPGSGSYIQNQDSGPQTASNFNISGTGTANIFNAGTQFNIQGSRVLFGSPISSNTFIGFNSGLGTVGGNFNTFAGRQAGEANIAGDYNSFFGFTAGQMTTAGQNSFFGSRAGRSNNIGTGNAFFGAFAGDANNIGNGNSFFGGSAGMFSTTGSSNVFVGASAGTSNSSGSQNTFVGATTGSMNTTGSNNTLIGSLANTTANGLEYATAIGAESSVSTNNTIVLGRSADSVMAPGSIDSPEYRTAGQRFLRQITDNLSVGLDTGSPSVGFQNTFVGSFAGNSALGALQDNSFFGFSSGRFTTSGSANSFFGSGSGASNSSGNGNTFVGNNAGFNNTIGSGNAFFGNGTGGSSTSGSDNTFIGRTSGIANISGSFNTTLGALADLSAGNLTYATAIGSGAVVSTSNTVVIGRNLDTVQIPGTLSANGSSLTNLNASNITTGTLDLARLDNGVILNSGSQQGGASFNISGFGLVAGELRGGNVNTQSNFRINGSRFAAAGNTTNTALGLNTGNPALGNSNTFAGYFAGFSSQGDNNSYFGMQAGHNSTFAIRNSIFGAQAGANATTSSLNAFFGYLSGGNTTIGGANTFIGDSAGRFNTVGGQNTFVGQSAGKGHQFGTGNSSLGFETEFSDNINNATAIGSRASVTQSNSIVLGSINGVNGATASTNVGIGTTAPGFRLHVEGATYIKGTLTVDGDIALVDLGAAGATPLCRNAINRIATCSSSMRYKTNAAGFSPGLELVKGLKPISFEWKEAGMLDLGLSAEDVAAIEPLLVTYNDKGEVEGVKYDRIGVVLVNAVKEQQKQIESQQRQIDELKAVICAKDAALSICKAKDK